ncbi:MAG TPA: Gfo/Idh/MocA family oxidoreductase [Clostridiales bacterium]|nr:Gfo/Idh/MocA family oxidoreductase [Clostridiales bacterium]
MAEFKVAVIGCGGIANGKHMPSLKQVPGVEMVAFCDIIIERAQAAAEKFGVEGARVYSCYKELLEKEQLDVVHVCTPNRSHCEISVAAMEAGCHVMCEKPMAINEADARTMLETAKKTGKKLTIGYQSRYRPDAQYLKAECEKGTLGEVYYAKAHAIRRRAVPTWGVFLNEYEQGGGPLVDIGTHALDLTLWMMDNYKPKYCVGTKYHKLSQQKGNTGNAWGDWNPDEFTVEDSAFGFIVMENGATIVLESSWALNTLDVHEAKTSLCGTLAGADMLNGLRINGVNNGRQYVLEPNFKAGGVAFVEGDSNARPEVLEALQWYHALKTNTDPCVLPEQAYIVSAILDGIYKSAISGEPFYFNK